MKKQVVESVGQAGAIRQGELEPSRVSEFAPVDVKAVRLRLGKSQSEFARMIGVSLATLHNWEQGRRRPEGPARALLKVAAENPDAPVFVRWCKTVEQATWTTFADVRATFASADQDARGRRPGVAPGRRR
jgi:putative transcriptional regulator